MEKLGHTKFWPISPITFKVMAIQKLIEQLIVIYNYMPKHFGSKSRSKYHVAIYFIELNVNLSFR